MTQLSAKKGLITKPSRMHQHQNSGVVHSPYYYNSEKIQIKELVILKQVWVERCQLFLNLITHQQHIINC